MQTQSRFCKVYLTKNKHQMPFSFLNVGRIFQRIIIRSTIKCLQFECRIITFVSDTALSRIVSQQNSVMPFFFYPTSVSPNGQNVIKLCFHRESCTIFNLQPTHLIVNYCFAFTFTRSFAQTILNSEQRVDSFHLRINLPLHYMELSI